MLESLIIISAILIVGFAYFKKKKESSPNYLNYEKLSGNTHTDYTIIGEKLLCKYLNKIKGIKRGLFNLYFMNGEKGTEVDSILIHPTGIYVIESKYYNGNVVGNWKENKWVHKSTKNTYREFYNPILQNKRHVSELEKRLEILTDKKFPIYSVIAFSNHTNLAVGKNREGNAIICKYKEIPKLIKNNVFKTDEDSYLSEDDIIFLAKELSKYTHVSEDIKEKHIEYVKRVQAIQ